MTFLVLHNHKSVLISHIQRNSEVTYPLCYAEANRSCRVLVLPATLLEKKQRERLCHGNCSSLADELSPGLSDYIFTVIIHILHLLAIRSIGANTMAAAENSVVAHAPANTRCATETKNNFLVSQSSMENISLYFLGCVITSLLQVYGSGSSRTAEQKYSSGACAIFTEP